MPWAPAVASPLLSLPEYIVGGGSQIQIALGLRETDTPMAAIGVSRCRISVEDTYM